MKNFTVPGFDNNLEENDEQPKIIRQLRQYINNLKHLEKQVPVNEAALKIMLPVFHSTTHSAKIMEQILKPDSKNTRYAWDERTVGMENLKLKAKTDTKG